MHLISIGVCALISVPAFVGDIAHAASPSRLETILPADFSVGNTRASLAWSGEDETWSAEALPEVKVPAVHEVDVEFVTALAAPEPPAMMLAGLALGGMLCGRSAIRGRR
jgi:hypothetical protein